MIEISPKLIADFTDLIFNYELDFCSFLLNSVLNQVSDFDD